MEAKKLKAIPQSAQLLDFDAEGNTYVVEPAAYGAQIAAQAKVINFPLPVEKTQPMQGELIISINEEGMVVTKRY